ncbi:RICIN domain-containing protein [Shewanella surugensis]|uniref:Ricin-type beta-trefoil lectin domain protein n=1 Tax=Shewanella surugensis TaxID=212020 RepID=A0ABT0L9J3_9GAMM|nr:RICIN domain-containing protein [Shewanella surugensis]MCL1124349.1 ricin-type beta-trefoil lectin domain protein [Shewanella surugensis]
MNIVNFFYRHIYYVFCVGALLPLFSLAEILVDRFPDVKGQLEFDGVVHDYFLDMPEGSRVFFQVKGGDGSGGYIKGASDSDGGVGATVGREFIIGELIPVGAKMRFIVGGQGLSYHESNFAHGGSGSGIFYQDPVTEDWHPLLVAGGGGAGGKHGVLGENGSAGVGVGDFSGGDGGQFGRGGDGTYNKGPDKSSGIAGGGGLYSRGGHVTADQHRNSDHDSGSRGGASAYPVLRGYFYGGGHNACIHKSKSGFELGQTIHYWDKCDTGSQENQEWSYDSITGQIRSSADHQYCLGFSQSGNNTESAILAKCSIDNNNSRFVYFNKQFHLKREPERCIARESNNVGANITLNTCHEDTIIENKSTWVVSFCPHGQEYQTNAYHPICVNYTAPTWQEYQRINPGPSGGDYGIFGVGGGGNGIAEELISTISAGGGGGGYSGGGAGAVSGGLSVGGGGGGGSYIGPDGNWDENQLNDDFVANDGHGYIGYQLPENISLLLSLGEGKVYLEWEAETCATLYRIYNDDHLLAEQSEVMWNGEVRSINNPNYQVIGINDQGEQCAVSSKLRAFDEVIDWLHVGLSITQGEVGYIKHNGVTICNTGNCSIHLPVALDIISLTASTNYANTRFIGWSGACSGSGACQISTDKGDQSLKANFIYEPPYGPW